MLMEFGIGLLIGAGGVFAVGALLVCFAFAKWMASGSH